MTTTPAPALPTSNAEALDTALLRSRQALLTQQAPEGYWWFTLQANETIGAGTIMLHRFADQVDPDLEAGLTRRLLSEQAPDGSWSLYHGGPGDVSCTVEAYFALRLAGYPTDHEALLRASRFVREHGGLLAIRIFTRIHLALFGLIPWSACPSMPAWLITMPVKSGFSVYEFSSWARASIVPLLLVMAHKPVRPVPFNLRELSNEPIPAKAWRLRASPQAGTAARCFIGIDRVLKQIEKLPWHPGRKSILKRCERWVRDHLERTEDIFPALNYGILGLLAAGSRPDDPHVQKAFKALRRFQQIYTGPLPGDAEPITREHPLHVQRSAPHDAQPDAHPDAQAIHQQCCISPLWDTPWMATALLAAGLEPGHPALLRAADYLIGKQITNFRGDWAIKNAHAPAGGWAFEFENDYFPDIDDTIQILSVLKQIDLTDVKKQEAIDRGYAWLMAMQSKNGAWAAFDTDNHSSWVNKIPFSDHGACLDPPTADITGRMLGLMAQFGSTCADPVVQKALKFLERTQRVSHDPGLHPLKVVDEIDPPFGGWWGRWGVNYIYGTWCVLDGLAGLGFRTDQTMIARSVRWLKTVQCPDGGWGESCHGYREDHFVGLPHGVPSQTAWAVLALMAVGETDSDAVTRGIRFLIDRQQADGSWEEAEHTGTGFPGHFYLRYHGYRQYFPLLALGRYQQKRLP